MATATQLAGGREQLAPVELALVGDRALVLRGLRSLIRADPLVRECAGAPRAASGPDVVVAHLSDLRESPVAEVDRVYTRFPSARLIVLVDDDDPSVSRCVLEAGASSVVLMDLAPEELLAAIHATAAGEQYLSPPVRRRLEALQAALVDTQLSTREMEVLWLIARGFTSIQVAARLGLSTRTIEAHRARIARKLDAKSRSELVRYALDRELLRV